MKKILILLVAICLCICSGCVSYRDGDEFIVKGVETHSDKYRYKYELHHIVDGKLCYETTLYSNEKYELNDTLRLMK